MTLRTSATRRSWRLTRRRRRPLRPGEPLARGPPRPTAGLRLLLFEAHLDTGYPQSQLRQGPAARGCRRGWPRRASLPETVQRLRCRRMGCTASHRHARGATTLLARQGEGPLGGRVLAAALRAAAALAPAPEEDDYDAEEAPEPAAAAAAAPAPAASAPSPGAPGRCGHPTNEPQRRCLSAAGACGGACIAARTNAARRQVPEPASRLTACKRCIHGLGRRRRTHCPSGSQPPSPDSLSQWQPAACFVVRRQSVLELPGLQADHAECKTKACFCCRAGATVAPAAAAAPQPAAPHVATPDQAPAPEQAPAIHGGLLRFSELFAPVPEPRAARLSVAERGPPSRAPPPDAGARPAAPEAVRRAPCTRVAPHAGCWGCCQG